MAVSKYSLETKKVNIIEIKKLDTMEWIYLVRQDLETKQNKLL